jgi:hypothetical protein
VKQKYFYAAAAADTRAFDSYRLITGIRPLIKLKNFSPDDDYIINE